MVPTFKAKINNGKIGVYAKDEFHIWLGSLEGQEVDITIKKFRKKRSTPANSYYFGVCVKLASDYTGNTINEIHKQNKQDIIGLGKLDGDYLTTTKMNTLQFFDYIESVKRLWAERGLFIPDPNTVEC